MSQPRLILHADLDAFFASVAQLDNPALRGRPVLVGGTGRRGVVSAASYEARRFGCRAAMPTGQALALCPAAVVVKPDFRRYSELSHRFMQELGKLSPLVEPLSVDEAFVDLTGTTHLHGGPEQVAAALRVAVRTSLGVPCSVGIAPNKFVAKLASDLAKPDGFRVIRAEELPQALAPLEIERMWGVGPATLPRFTALGITRFGHLQSMTEPEVRRVLGEHGVEWWRLARGEDSRPVSNDRDAKGIGHEQTFMEDLSDPESLLDVLLHLAERTAFRLRASRGLATNVTIKLRTPDFRTVTRSSALAEPTDATDVIWAAAKSLFERWAASGRQPLRLIGVHVARAPILGAQLPLFSPRAEQEARRTVDSVADRIAERFGRDAIQRGRSLRVGQKRRTQGPSHGGAAPP